jgi:hypothetical protein
LRLHGSAFPSITQRERKFSWKKDKFSIGTHSSIIDVNLSFDVVRVEGCGEACGRGEREVVGKNGELRGFGADLLLKV